MRGGCNQSGTGVQGVRGVGRYGVFTGQKAAPDFLLSGAHFRSHGDMGSVNLAVPPRGSPALAQGFPWVP